MESYFADVMPSRKTTDSRRRHGQPAFDKQYRRRFSPLNHRYQCRQSPLCDGIEAVKSGRSVERCRISAYRRFTALPHVVLASQHRLKPFD